MELTPRQLDVLELVAQGASFAEAARRLVIAASTVNSHLDRIRERLGARSSAHAVAIAYERGWLPRKLEGGA